MPEPAPEAIQRVRLVAYEYEVRAGDLLVTGDGEGQHKRVVRVRADDTGAVITLDGEEEPRTYTRQTLVEVWRDVDAVPGDSADYVGTIVA